MYRQTIKSLIIFIALIAIMFYIAHSFARESKTEHTLNETRASTFLDLTLKLQGITFDIDFVKSLSAVGTAEPAIAETLSRSQVGRPNPFSSARGQRIGPAPTPQKPPAPVAEPQVLILP